MLIRGKISAVTSLLYVVAQLFGGFIGGCGGALILTGDEAEVRPPIGAPDLAEGVGRGSAFLAEVIITFALAHTVLNVATTAAQSNNSYYGLAIGFTVVSGAISVGGVSGGCFNPAVAMVTLARAISTKEVTEHIWIHILGPLVGGGLAGAFFVLFQPHELPRDHKFSEERTSPRSVDLRKRAATFAYEWVGTFQLCFAVACAASPKNTTGLAPMAIGSMLMAMVYSGGAVSGANYNPAVTIAVLVRKAEGYWDALFYILWQCAAAACAGGFARAVIGDIGYPVPAHEDEYNDGRAFWAELVGTFFLCYVVLQSATNSLVAGNSFFGLAIGYTVTAMAIAVGPVSGGAFNPAVSLLGVACCLNFNVTVSHRLWIYWVGPPIGALLAGLVFRNVSREEKVITNKSCKSLTESGVTHGRRRRSLVHADPPPATATPGESFNKYFPSSSDLSSAAKIAGPPSDPPPEVEKKPSSVKEAV